MAYKAGSAFVSVTPSFRGWQTKVAAFTKSNLRAIEIPATVKVDEARATADVKAATARVANRAGSKAKVKVDADTSLAMRALGRLERRLSRLSRGRALINAAVVASPLAVPVGAAAIGGLGAGAAVAAPVAAGVGGFAAIAGAQLGKLKELRKNLKDAGKNVSDAQAAQDAAQARADAATTDSGKASAKLRLAETTTKLNSALAAQKALQDSVTATQQKAMDSQDRLKKSWDKFLVSIEKPVLGTLIGGMGALTKAMPALGKFITPVAGAFDRMFTALGDATATKGFQSFSKTFGTFASKILGDATEGLMNLGRAFGSLFAAFMPIGNEMSNGLVGLTARFAAWSATIADSKGFRSFIDYFRTNGPLVLSVLGQLVLAIIQIGVALAPMAAAMLSGLGSFARWVAKTAEAHPWLIRIVAGFGLFVAAVALVAKPLTAAVGAVRVLITVVRILSLVFLANPIGLVVTALIALGVGLVVAYKKSETFRRIVDNAWIRVKESARASWEFIKTVFAGLKTGAKSVGDAFVSMKNGLSAAWSAIKTKARDSMVWVIDKMLWFAEKVLTAAVKAFGWAPGIGDDVKKALEHVKDLRKGVETELHAINDENVHINLTARALKLTGIEAKMFGGQGGAGKAPHGGHGGPGPSLRAATSGLPQALGTTRSNVGAYNDAVSARFSEKLSKFLEAMPFGSFGPKGKVLRKGSYRVGMPYLGYPGHYGADYPASIGTPVYAMASGNVQRALSMAGSYGKHVFLGHPGNVQTRYAHMSRLMVKPGQSVRAGQQIGAVGSTGNSTGPHLHFEYRRGGRPVNPAGLGIFDSGGMLPPGLSTVYNGTGKPEPVMTGGQFDSLSKLANKGASTSGRLTITNWEKGTAYFESIADGVAGGREDLTATAGRMR